MRHARINLNADLGESFGAWSMGRDGEMLQLVTSANVACGFHAGDPLVMRHTVATALRHGVSIGAHPSFPDLQGFGRRRIDMAPAELEAMVVYQIGALQGIAAAEDHRVTHVKPHGALNNMACENLDLARCIARAVRAAGPELLQACRLLKGCQTGDAKITPGYRLRAKHVIHTVGPVWHDGRRGEPELLASCYRRAIEVATTQGIASLAFPGISTGVYGYPVELAASVAIRTVRAALPQFTGIGEVIFCCFADGDLALYDRLLGGLAAG